MRVCVCRKRANLYADSARMKGKRFIEALADVEIAVTDAAAAPRTIFQCY